MRRRNRCALVLLATFAASSTVASASRADDAELAGLLEETVVTTASKASELESTAPATSSVITAEQIRQHGMRTIGEAIDFLSLGATGASPSSGTGFGVRGVHVEGDANAHVLLLIDGHAVNDFTRGVAPLGYDAGIPIELVDHIELVLGPGSVLYGSNAMLGVVNVITKRASAFRGVRIGVESDVPYSARGFVGAGHEFVFLGAPSELTVAVEYRRSVDPGLFYAAQNTGIDPVTGKLARYGDGPGTGVWGGRTTENGSLEEPALYARFVSGNFEATFRAASHETGLHLGFAHFDDPTNRLITRRFGAEIKHRASLTSVLAVSTRLYADSADEQNSFETSLGRTCPRGGATCRFANVGVARWAGVELQATLDWAKDGSFVTLVGIDPRLRSGQAKTDTFDAETGALLGNSSAVIDRTDGVVGAYLQQTWKPLPWLAFNGGMRLDYDARFAPVVSPRVAASVNVWHGGVLKGVYSQAFRAPSFNDSYFTHALQPMSDLRPEHVESAEMSIEQKLGAHRLLFGAFRSTWTNLIEMHTFSAAEAAEYVRTGKSALAPLYQFENQERIQNYGFNAGFEGAVAAGRLRYGVNVTGAISRTEDPELGALPTNTAPRVFGNARVSYALSNGLPTLGLAGLYTAKRPTAGAYRGGDYPSTPHAPAQLGLRATVSGPAPWVKGLSYRISASYLFADRSSSTVGPLATGGAGRGPDLQPLTQLTTTVGLLYEF